jgi:outer membrane receptor for ferric coprogen and ferric-rhodotorulic acid
MRGAGCRFRPDPIGFARVSFSLNIDNALNKSYYATVASNIASLGAPQNFRFSTTVDF